MPAHIRAALTQTSLSIPVIDGAWLWARGRVFICSSTATEPYRRSVVLQLLSLKLLHHAAARPQDRGDFQIVEQGSLSTGLAAGVVAAAAMAIGAGSS